MTDEPEFWAELELPGLGKLDKLIRIDSPRPHLDLPLATCMVATGFWAGIAEAASINFKRYRFIKVGMYPSAWGFKDKDEHGRAVPYVKAFKVLYELGEII